MLISALNIPALADDYTCDGGDLGVCTPPPDQAEASPPEKLRDWYGDILLNTCPDQIQARAAEEGWTAGFPQTEQGFDPAAIERIGGTWDNPDCGDDKPDRLARYLLLFSGYFSAVRTNYQYYRIGANGVPAAINSPVTRWREGEFWARANKKGAVQIEFDPETPETVNQQNVADAVCRLTRRRTGCTIYTRAEPATP
ncbi:MAG: hypothetical protein HYT79_02920 [Elusimicrobia bacterium]|nr:hypothetical protein [Elusimicrobiota bacterium]